MVKTGMTRRIDELGRLVIPKEIRNNLKIKDNDQVEIMVVDNKIILNKYDNINKDKNISIILDCLKRNINRNILYSSRDKIVDYSIITKENSNNLELNDELINIIENRKEVVNYQIKDMIYTISPIIINGDLYGSLITYDENNILDKDLELIKFSKMFLEKYLE